MAKRLRNKSLKTTRNKKLQKPKKQLLQSEQPKKQKTKTSKILKLLSWLIPILLGAYFYYAPKISIEFYEPLEKSQPFISPFVIKNEGNSKLSTIFLKEFILDKTVINALFIQDLQLNFFTVGVNKILKEELKSNKSHTFVLNFADALIRHGSPLKDITAVQSQLKIFISYYWFFIKIEETFSFKIITFENGIIKWVPMEE